MIDGIEAAIRAKTPAADEPGILKLLRRLHAAGDRDGVRAIRAVLHAEREAAAARYRDRLNAGKAAATAKELAEHEAAEAKKLALLADAIDAPPAPTEG